MTLTPPTLAGPMPVTASTVGPALRELHARGNLELPRPGEGDTWGRWDALAQISAQDLVLGRLAEAHTDAVAVLGELGGPPADGLWGVWAAEPPDSVVTARATTNGWLLSGRKAWCSGALVLDRALVTTPVGRRLFAVAVADLTPVDGTWNAVGMASSGSVSVLLDDVPAVAVGGPGDYLDRPGFWHGGAGVAACWYGGAVGAARVLLDTARARDLDAHALAHLGAVDALLSGMAAHLQRAAREIDQDPSGAGARLRAVRVRAHVEAGATEVLDRVGRALGAAPLCLDAVQAQRAADLPVYLRQSHAERDLAGLGALAVAEATW